MVPPIVRWTDDRYSFTLPREIQHQLKLSPDQFLTYGELQLLPPGKRAKVHPSVTALQVIRARIPLPNEPLAASCSSYTQQHNLDRGHLERRGIFASVVEKNGEFLFLDPIRFVALLGTVTDIAIPLDLGKAFHQIGNAISVPHALLSFLIMLSSITKQQLPIQECLRKCWLSMAEPYPCRCDCCSGSQRPRLDQEHCPICSHASEAQVPCDLTQCQGHLSG